MLSIDGDDDSNDGGGGGGDGGSDNGEEEDMCKWFKIRVPSCENCYVVDNYSARMTAHVHSN